MTKYIIELFLYAFKLDIWVCVCARVCVYVLQDECVYVWRIFYEPKLFLGVSYHILPCL